jgi:hypothetical protein
MERDGMTVAILISGSIFKEPQQRTSQAGRRFVSTTLKVGGESGNAEFWSALAFGTTAGGELLRLGLNERVAVQGSLKLEIFTKDGEPRISRTIFVDSVLALRAPPKERKPKSPPAGKQSILPDATPEKETAAGGPAFFNDDIPFEAVR